MADKTDDLVIGVSTDLSSVQRAIRKLDGEIARASSQIERRFSAVGKGIDRAMPSAMQDRINKMAEVQTTATKEWTGALAEQGREMERLRARFNPMFSTISNYKSAIAEIRAAHRLGAISADEMAGAIQRERQAALSSIAAIKQRNAAISGAPGLSKGASNFNTANIAAQFQDIAVMTQMGIANPLTIALQQGTQLSAVFNQMGGTRDVIKGIGAAFLQIVNPISLVTIGTIAAGVAAYNYFSASEDGAATTKKALEEQEQLIQRVARAWGDVLPHVRAVAAEQDRLAGKLDIETTTQQSLTKVFRDIGEQVKSTREEIDGVADLLSRQLPVEQYSLLNSTLSGLTDSAGKNKTTVEDMTAAHRLMSDLFSKTQIPVFRDTADAISALIPGLAEVRAEMDAIAARDAVAQQFNDLHAAISSIDSAKARDELQKLMDQAKTGEISVADLLAELAKISSYAPDVSGIISAFRTVAEAAEAARKSTALFTGKASTGGPARYQPHAVTLPMVGPTPTERGTPELGGFPWEEFGKKRGGGSRAPKRTADDRFFEDIEAIKQRSIALAEERAQLGLSYEAQQKRKTAFELEQKALKDAREEARKKGDQDWQNAQLTPDQISKIDEVSAAYARQADELRKAQNELAFQKDLMRGALGDLKSALSDGKLEWEELGQVAANVLDKITDKLLDDVVNAIFEVNRAGSMGGGGGILGGIFSLFGGGGGFKATTTLGNFLQGIPGFAAGTNNAPGGVALVGERGPELVNLPRGAQVIPNHQLRAPTIPKLAGIGGGGATVNAPISITIDATGADAAGLARLQREVASLKQTLPQTIVSTVKGAQDRRGL